MPTSGQKKTLNKKPSFILQGIENENQSKPIVNKRK